MSEKTPLQIEDWGLLNYSDSFERQAQMVLNRLDGSGVDTLILVEHPATVTMGKRASADDLYLSETQYLDQGISLQKINRGGLATAHEPGQLVVYPIIQLKKKDLRWYADSFLTVVVDILDQYGLSGSLKEGDPGVWVNGRKICSFGIALKRWVSSHGIALNVNNSLSTFSTIVPCGHRQEIVTSIAKELGHDVDLTDLKERFALRFCQMFDYDPRSNP